MGFFLFELLETGFLEFPKIFLYYWTWWHVQKWSWLIICQPIFCHELFKFFDTSFLFPCHFGSCLPGFWWGKRGWGHAQMFPGTPQCMRKPPGPKGFFLQEKTPEAVAAKRKEKEAWHWLSNTCHCSMKKSMLILQSQARLKLSRMTRFRAATDRHVERLESSGNGSWNHFLELLFAFCHFQVSTKYSWWKRVLRFFRAKRKRKQGAPCPPHTRGGEVAQVCRKKYFSRIDGLEGLPFNPSIRMLL